MLTVVARFMGRIFLMIRKTLNDRIGHRQQLLMKLRLRRCCRLLSYMSPSRGLFPYF